VRGQLPLRTKRGSVRLAVVCSYRQMG
jgi:hypothetical protein